MQFIPSSNYPSSINNTPSANSAPGLPDTLRIGGPLRLSPTVNGRHPLEARVLHWDATQEALHTESRRRLHGLADPLKREMDAALVGMHPARVGLSRGESLLHEEILAGKECTVDWEDIYPDAKQSSVHVQMESKILD